MRSVRIFLFVAALSVASISACGQVLTANIQGRVYDSSGAVIPEAAVSVTNTKTKFSRSVQTFPNGDYEIRQLPVGDYTVTAEKPGFQKQAKRVHLDLGAVASVDFALPPGMVAQGVEVQDVGAAAEPTRTMVSSVIDETRIENLPVNGRQFIDFALLAPGVTVGDTTSGSTDAIVEPGTKLSFAGQNIHFNLIAVDGADNISTASGVQKTTPSQEAVLEFRVINSSYSTELGRAVGGIVNIITRGGTNQIHGSVYEYFRNDALDARSILASPGLDKLRQNQFGFTIGGPVVRDKTFFFGNYEGQRRRESPIYNSFVLQNIDCPNEPVCPSINSAKIRFGLRPENLNVTRTTDYDNFLVRLDHTVSARNYFFVRYFFNDGRLTNLSALNDGFDLPSAFRNNSLRDQSLAGSFNTTFSNTLVNELRAQYAHRSFNFPVVVGEPHLEVANTFSSGQNRGNPEFYREWRVELADTVTKSSGRHTIGFGGSFNYVRTEESFLLFYPFEAIFNTLSDMLAGTPAVVFFQRFEPPNFTEPTFDTSLFFQSGIPQSRRDQSSTELGRTFDALFIQDRWRATERLTLNFGVRWEFETWPDRALESQKDNVDPRLGFAYSLGTRKNIVIRGGAGLFRGIVPSPVFFPQGSCCGGHAKFPGRETIENDLNAATKLFAFASAPPIMGLALQNFLGGTYPDAVPLPFCPGGVLSGCGFFGEAVIVRFARRHKNPYGIQSSLEVEFQPFKDTVMTVGYLRVKGVHLGSFFNVNQPAPDPLKQMVAHDSRGNTGLKQTYWVVPPVFDTLNRILIPGFPGVRDSRYAIYLEADSKWNSQFNGLLVNLNKRMGRHIGYGISYTWSKTIDDGPNPSFVLIPQDSLNIRRERALSSDHVAHRFVGSATIAGPTNAHALINNFKFGLIATLESPHYFTKLAGFDANGDIFNVNDRVGIEPRNTFQGDGYHTFDLRVSRLFRLNERTQMEAIAEAFNVFNTLNVRFFNTVYGAADFNPPGTAGTFLEGSPNPAYGTPRSVYNPQQIQFALRLTF